jgi:plastocyanin
MSKKKRKKSGGGGIPPGLQQNMGWIVAGAVAAVAGIVILFLVLSGGSESEGGSSTSARTPTPDPRVAGATPATTISVEADDEGQQVNPRFVPAALQGPAGDVVAIDIANVGSVAHNLRVSGLDKQYETADDFTSLTVQPEKQQQLLVKIDAAGAYPFRCDFHPQQTGTLTLN